MVDEPTKKHAKMTEDDPTVATKPPPETAAAAAATARKLAKKIQLDIPRKIEKLKHHREHECVSNRFRVQMNEYFPTGQYSDVTIKFSDDQELRAHKAIVCSYSDVWRKACKGQFAESKTGVINVSYDDTEIVLFMIQWMYTGNAVAPSGQKPLIFHIRLYAAAEFYQMRVLRNEMIRSVLHDVRDQLRRISDDVTLPEAVKLIYSSTPESDRRLRDAVVAFCAKNYAYCARNKGFKKIEVMEFWRDLCRRVKKDLYNKVDDPDDSDDSDDSDSRRDAVMLRTFREYKCELCGVLFLVPEAAAKPEICVFCSEDEVEDFQRLGSSIVQRLSDSLHSFESEQAGHKYEPIIDCTPPHIAMLYPG